MKISIVALLSAFALLASPCLAMGRKPSDPATWGDVTTVQDQVNRNAATESDHNAKTNERIDNLEALRPMLEGDLRFYDGKHLALSAFSGFDVNRSHFDTAGLRITLKVGKSYEETLVAKQQKLIDQLTALISKREGVAQ